MVDCGLSFKRMKEDLYLVDTLLITHRHTDHVNPRTLDRIRREFPNITVVGNWEIASRWDIDVICNEGYPVEVNGITYTPFKGRHNVLCYGYTWEDGGKRFIYATDMSDFSGSPEGMTYDYMFLESNHDVHKLNAALGAKSRWGYDAYGAGLMHCSTQTCLAFYYTHKRGKDSKLIELHKSDRFY